MPRKFRTLPHISGCDLPALRRSSVRLLRSEPRTDRSCAVRLDPEADQKRSIGPGGIFRARTRTVAIAPAATDFVSVTRFQIDEADLDADAIETPTISDSATVIGAVLTTPT